jgi:hypothetical protein
MYSKSGKWHSAAVVVRVALVMAMGGDVVADRDVVAGVADDAVGVGVGVGVVGVGVADVDVAGGCDDGAGKVAGEIELVNDRPVAR